MITSVLDTLGFGDARYERKFLTSDLSFEEVVSLLWLHPACFREFYPARWVNSIYLDSPALSCYYVHVNGVSNRYKVRVRWYGDLEGEIREPRLEFKLRRGLLGGKIIKKFPRFVLETHAPGRSLMEVLPFSEEVEEGYRDHLKMFSPALLNRYRRHYYQSQDGKFRITLDKGLEFYDPAQPCLEWLNLNRTRATPIILELKYPLKYEQEAQAITNGLPFRLTRCSKYVLGIERRYGN